jgi:hypothetical protein
MLMGCNHGAIWSKMVYAVLTAVLYPEGETKVIVRDLEVNYTL